MSELHSRVWRHSKNYKGNKIIWTQHTARGLVSGRFNTREWAAVCEASAAPTRQVTERGAVDEIMERWHCS